MIATAIKKEINTTGCRLAECRKSLKLSQREVADFIGVDQTAVSKYEKGNFLPTPDKMKKLSLLYEKPITWLFFSE